VTLILEGLFMLRLVASVSLEPGPGTGQNDGWVTDCRPGTDGFAVNCIARKKVGDLILLVSVSDSQYVQRVEHSRCRPPEPRTALREDVIALPARQRRRIAIQTFLDLARDMARNCKRASTLKGSEVGTPPDLAVAGEEFLRHGP
jgi:hypothetical protein